MSVHQLDALNPPAPAQLVADMKVVGATAMAVYVFRRNAPGQSIGIGSWTKAHIDAVKAQGYGLSAILVPGNRPGNDDWRLAVQTASALGIPAGWMWLDLEQSSFPPFEWVRWTIAQLRAASWHPGRYGDKDRLANYPAADGDWLSHGAIIVRENRPLPVPAVPAGTVADQYSVGVIINNHAYDSSTVDPRVYAGQVSASTIRSGGGAVGLATEDTTKEPFWEVQIRGEDRHVMLAWWSGGMGQRDGYKGPLTDLGRPPGDALPVRAECTITAHVAGHPRVDVVAVTDDGKPWGLVFGDEQGSGHGIVQDWTPWQVSNCPTVYVPPADEIAAHRHKLVTGETGAAEFE